MANTDARRIVTRMNIDTSFSRIVPVVAIVIAAATTASCGDGAEDSPEYCASIDSLKSSVSALTDIPIDQGALGELETRLERVKSDVEDVKDEAGDEFATEIDAMEKAASTFGSSLDAAVATPSLTTVSAVGTAAQDLGTSLKTLADAVKDTC